MNKIRIGLNGAGGKMCLSIQNLIENNQDFDLVAQINRQHTVSEYFIFFVVVRHKCKVTVECFQSVTKVLDLHGKGFLHSVGHPFLLSNEGIIWQ